MSSEHGSSCRVCNNCGKKKRYHENSRKEPCYSGILISLRGNHLKIDTEEGVLSIPYEEIRRVGYAKDCDNSSHHGAAPVRCWRKGESSHQGSGESSGNRGRKRKRMHLPAFYIPNNSLYDHRMNGHSSQKCGHCSNRESPLEKLRRLIGKEINIYCN